MKMKSIVFTVCLMTIMIYSCKKDNDEDITTPPSITNYKNYSQLKVGNYWIYEEFNVDSLGNATTKNIFDSCYVEKDTMINAKSYYKIVKPNPYSSDQKSVSFQRDSLHYIVDSDGAILFSSQDFASTLETNYLVFESDTLCVIKRKMTDKNITVNTPAGTFITLNAKEIYSMSPPWTFAGNPRYRNIKYAENIGIVVETLPFLISNPNYIERRLVRYYVDQILYITK